MEHQPDTHPSKPDSPRSSGVRRYWLLEALSWLIIAAIIVLKGVMPAFVAKELPPEGFSESSALESQIVKLQGQMVLAASAMSGDQNPELLVEQIKPLETGSVGQRQRAVILFGVVCDSAQARSSLKRLEEAASEYGIPFSDEQLRTNSILEGLFESVVPGEDQFGELSADEETFLREQLGWFGELAIARTQGDDKSQWSEVLNSSMLKLVIVIAFMSIGGLLALLGIIGLILCIVSFCKGRLHLLRPRHGGGVYVETFACWLVLFLVFNEILVGLAVRIELPILGSVIGFFLSLVALYWLILRGMTWADAMRQIGLHRGAGWWRELFAGMAGYAMMLPILVVGVIGVLLLTVLQKSLSSSKNPFVVESNGAHPIVGMFENASIPELILVFAVACVAAPIVEEITFRGVLYRGLRDQTGRRSALGSIAISGLVSGFIFAAIHPQGWVAIPALGAIGFAMALAREWRGSLIAPMVMHAINNTVVMTVMVLMLG